MTSGALPQTDPDTTRMPRVASVDTMRGLTILLMVFVNDLGPAAPAWMHHIQPPDADGMTLADVVFPLFLFIAGVSIPLAVQTARQRGQSELRICGHILLRSAALLLMGLIGVNRAAEVQLGGATWGLLAYISVILAWCVVPRTPGRRRRIFQVLKGVGVVGVLAMLAVFRREPVATEIAIVGPVQDWSWLTTSWWGILGLIGWSYLLAALVYLVLGRRREWLMAAAGLSMANFLAFRQGGYFTRTGDKTWLTPLQTLITSLQTLVESLNSYVDIASILGSLPAVMLCGCLLGTILLPDSGITTPSQRCRWSLVYAAGLFLAGLITDTFAGINKIAATPTWCFWCASLATLCWLVLYLVVDVRRISAWTLLVRPAGAHPLIAYLLHPIILFSLSLAGLSTTIRSYAQGSPAVTILGSLAMAAVVCGLTGLIARAGLRIRV